MTNRLYVIRVKKSKGLAKKGRFMSWMYHFATDLNKAEMYTKQDATEVLSVEELGPYKGCFEIVPVELKLLK